MYIKILNIKLAWRTVKQCLTNDKIRKLFLDLLMSEISILNNFTKYGKLKGYINEPPQFNINKAFSLK